MLNVNLGQLKSDLTPMLKGTSLRVISDPYGIAFSAANRILGRIDPMETIRTAVLATPFYDNVQDYVPPEDIKRTLDIRPQLNLRQDQPGLSIYSETTPRQFSTRLDPNSFSIRWNNMVRTLRAQRLPAGNVAVMDEFDSLTGNGSWSAEVDASGLAVEPLNFVQGNGSLSFNLSGATGAGDLLNSTAASLDLSSYNYEDASMIYFFIPIGFSARFTSFALRRGNSASAYKEATVTTKADGTAFSDGWNFLMFNWSTATTTGSPTNTTNTYRRFGISYSTGAVITGCLIDNWTNAFGQLYEMEYYSEYMFRTAAGAWISRPTLDTDLVNVGPLSYEILKNEMMIDITKIIRTGNVRTQELAELYRTINGDPQSRWVKDPVFKGLYNDYMNKFPSSAIVTSTQYYDFDV